jgi:hypothetical protein
VTTQQDGSRFVAVLGAPGGRGALIADLVAAAGGLAAVEKPNAVNDELLEVLRATRTAPPELSELSDGWEAAPEVVALAERGRAALDQGDVVWFDGATAPLFAFWSRLVAAPDLCIVVIDDPTVVVAALRREGLDPAHAEALVRITDREARHASDGARTVFVDATRVAVDPEPELEAFARACQEVGLPIDVASAREWWRAHGAPPAEGPALTPTAEVPAWCEELLRLHLQVHRAGLDARAAWLSADADHGELERDAAVAAAEREAALLRDQVIGLQAERANLSATMAALEGHWRAAEQRADAIAERLVDLDLDQLEHARHQRDEMLVSPQWRVGRAVVGPVRRLRQWFGRPS